MSAVTTSTDLRTLLKLALPIGSRLITGDPDTPVTWVSQLRTRPPILADLEGSELVLVSTSTLANYQKPITIETIIRELSHTRVSALAVRGTLTPHIHQVARQHDFPLISLPDRAVLPQVERTIQRLLTNRPAQIAQRAFELEQTLQRHAASYRGLTTMLNVMARVTDRPVVIHDLRGDVLSRGLPSTREGEWEAKLALTNGSDWMRWVDLRAGQRDGELQMSETPAGLTALLVENDRTLGCVSLLCDVDSLDDFDMLALEHCAPILAREVARQQTAEATIEPPALSRDWMADWLSGAAPDDMLLSLRAEKDNYCPEIWYAPVLFRVTPRRERAGTGISTERVVRIIQLEMRQRRILTPVGHYLDRVILLFPLEEPQQTQRLKQMVELLQDQILANIPNSEATVGVGRPVQGLTALRESYDEADRALTLPEQLQDESRVAFFGDLSLYELLMGVGDRKMLRHFCDHWLAPLIAYDAQHHTELLLTLRSYFANNGNMARTSHCLSIHRNTLVYRLGRITDIIELDMDDSNVRLNLHLALKIHRLLEQPHAQAGSG